MSPGPITPHGGTLVNRLDEALDEGGNRPRVTLSPRQQADLDLIAVGAMSPLDGFMDRAAYESVMTDMRLPSGLAWSVPVTLGVPADELDGVGTAAEVELVDESGRFLGVLEVTDRYETDPVREAKLVYGTDEEAHPGVASLYAHGTTALAGPVRVAARLPLDPGAVPFLLDPLRLARGVRRPRVGQRGRVPDPQPDPPRPRVHHQGARWRRSTACSCIRSWGRPRATTSPPTCGCAATRS